MQLRSGVAVAVAVAVAAAGGYSSNLTPSLGTSMCHKCSPKKDKRQNKYIKAFQVTLMYTWDWELVTG